MRQARPFNEQEPISMNQTNQLTSRIVTFAGLTAVCANAHAGQPLPFKEAGTSQPPPLAPKPAPPAAEGGTNEVATSVNPVEQFLDGRIPDAIAKGKVNLDVRLRYEQVDEEGLAAITKNSYAPTIRTRLGYTTAPLYGFQGMLEGVNISAFGLEHKYNAAGANGQGDRPVVADPELTRVDQYWLGYTYTNYFSVKVGEQRIDLDNQRFVGEVAWRQNIQTFEAVTASSEPIEGLNLNYGYVWRVHRVYGNVAGLPPANTDFNSASHLINISYSGWQYGRFVGYTYLLDLENSAGNNNSCATYGGYFAGAAPIGENAAVDYRGEVAGQTDYGDSAFNYDALYFNLEAGGRFSRFAGGAGYEFLGSGVNSGPAGGRAGFRTPLATLHPFNGWADVFLTTPSAGLRDLYVYAQVTLPAEIPILFTYHKFDAASGTGDYGQEFDISVSKKLGKHWKALAKYAYYNGADAAPPSLASANVDLQKFWVQLEFTF
jgi:hypothetical protein